MLRFLGFSLRAVAKECPLHPVIPKETILLDLKALLLEAGQHVARLALQLAAAVGNCGGTCFTVKPWRSEA